MFKKNQYLKKTEFLKTEDSPQIAGRASIFGHLCSYFSHVKRNAVPYYFITKDQYEPHSCNAGVYSELRETVVFDVEAIDVRLVYPVSECIIYI